MGCYGKQVHSNAWHGEHDGYDGDEYKAED